MSESESKPRWADLDALILEYRECNTSYNARDNLVQGQFHKIAQTFSIFVTLLLAFRVFINADLAFRLIFLLTMGFTGLLSLVAIMSDLQSNASCKIAIRRRARQIEDLLFPDREFGLWRTIEGRGKYPEERIIKRIIQGRRASLSDSNEPEKGVFVVAARLVILLYILIVVAVAIL
jgi:hypothetical protein